MTPLKMLYCFYKWRLIVVSLIRKINNLCAKKNKCSLFVMAHYTEPAKNWQGICIGVQLGLYLLATLAWKSMLT